MPEQLIREAKCFLSEFSKLQNLERESKAIEGASLASKLRENAISLSYSKATESSPDIVILHFLAAQVAVCAFGPYSNQLAAYENDIRYYSSFRSTKRYANDYEIFKHSN